jgi:hypothetical protein
LNSRAADLEDRYVEMAKALGVGDQVDCDDLPACNREAEYDTRPSPRSPLKQLVDAGAATQQAIRDVGGGRLIASVKDADGNIIGLLQSP